MTFVTDHFSTYVIMYIDPESDEEGLPIIYAVIAVIVIQALIGDVAVKKRRA